MIKMTRKKLSATKINQKSHKKALTVTKSQKMKKLTQHMQLAQTGLKEEWKKILLSFH